MLWSSIFVFLLVCKLIFLACLALFGLFNSFFNSSYIIVHSFCVTIQLLFGCCLVLLLVGWIPFCCWLTPFALLIEFFYIVDKFFLYCCSFLLHCYLTFLVLFSCYLALLVVISSSCCVVQFIFLVPIIIIIILLCYFALFIGWFDSSCCWSTPFVNAL